jgi:hypothetical protein
MKNSKDNMSVLLVLFPNHTKKQDGFVVPPLAPDEEEQEHIRQQSAQEADVRCLLPLFFALLFLPTAPLALPVTPRPSLLLLPPTHLDHVALVLPCFQIHSSHFRSLHLTRLLTDAHNTHTRTRHDTT